MLCEQIYQAAVQVAELIASFPQECMLVDRHSAIGSLSLDGYSKPIQFEFREGERILQLAVEGAKRFAKGEGRHGAVSSSTTTSTSKQKSDDPNTEESPLLLSRL